MRRTFRGESGRKVCRIGVTHAGGSSLEGIPAGFLVLQDPGRDSRKALPGERVAIGIAQGERRNGDRFPLGCCIALRCNATGEISVFPGCHDKGRLEIAPCAGS